MRKSWETMTSVSAGHIILTPTQPVGFERPQRESNPGPLPTELSRPPTINNKVITFLPDRFIDKLSNIRTSSKDEEFLERDWSQH